MPVTRGRGRYIFGRFSLLTFTSRTVVVFYHWIVRCHWMCFSAGLRRFPQDPSAQTLVTCSNSSSHYSLLTLVKSTAGKFLWLPYCQYRKCWCGAESESLACPDVNSCPGISTSLGVETSDTSRMQKAAAVNGWSRLCVRIALSYRVSGRLGPL